MSRGVGCLAILRVPKLFHDVPPICPRREEDGRGALPKVVKPLPSQPSPFDEISEHLSDERLKPLGDITGIQRRADRRREDELPVFSACPCGCCPSWLNDKSVREWPGSFHGVAFDRRSGGGAT